MAPCKAAMEAIAAALVDEKVVDAEEEEPAVEKAVAAAAEEVVVEVEARVLPAASKLRRREVVAERVQVQVREVE